MFPYGRRQGEKGGRATAPGAYSNLTAFGQSSEPYVYIQIYIYIYIYIIYIYITLYYIVLIILYIHTSPGACVPKLSETAMPPFAVCVPWS